MRNFVFFVLLPIKIYSDALTIVCLCSTGRFHAFEKAHNMDPNSSGRGVRQFKTFLLHRLERVKMINYELFASKLPFASFIEMIL